MTISHFGYLRLSSCPVKLRISLNHMHHWSIDLSSWSHLAIIQAIPTCLVYFTFNLIYITVNFHWIIEFRIKYLINLLPFWSFEWPIYNSVDQIKIEPGLHLINIIQFLVCQNNCPAVIISIFCLWAIFAATMLFRIILLCRSWWHVCGVLTKANKIYRHWRWWRMQTNIFKFLRSKIFFYSCRATELNTTFDTFSTFSIYLLYWSK